MGVIRTENEQRPIKVEEITYADYVFDDTEDEQTDGSEEDTSPNPPTVEHANVYRKKKHRNNRAERRIQRFLDVEYAVAGIKNRGRLGSRKLKRLENARMICAGIDPNDICDDFSDIVPDTLSNFALLFIDQSNMRAWNEFIEKDEDEQQEFLDHCDSLKKTDMDENKGQCVGTSSNRHYRDKLPAEEDLDRDSRKHHPAYSAAACFSRLDIRFKSIFSKGKLPWAFMSDAENTLRRFFIGSNKTDTKTEWTSVPIESAWLRLILHGVSQYLSLHSKSYFNDFGEKVVRVRNNRPYFIPPHKNLVGFLVDHRKSRSSTDSFG